MKKILYLVLTLLMPLACFGQTAVFTGTAVGIGQTLTLPVTLQVQLTGCSPDVPHLTSGGSVITNFYSVIAPSPTFIATATVYGNDIITCNNQQYTTYAVTWNVNGRPAAPTATYRIVQGQTCNISDGSCKPIGFTPAQVNNATGVACAAGYNLQGFNSQFVPQCVLAPAAGPTGPQGPAGAAGGAQVSAGITTLLKGTGTLNQTVAGVPGIDYMVPGSAAGGDLSGTYPNPTVPNVVKINSASNQVLSQTSNSSLLVNNVNFVTNINGDGTTDNTAAIQTAVNACPQSPTVTNGQSCQINLNNVVIASTVTIPTGADYLFTGNLTTLCTGSGVNCFQRTVASGAYEAHRIKFSHFFFVKTNTGAVIADLQVFNSQGNQGATLDNNTFVLTGSAIGWIAQGGCFNVVTNNVFTSSRDSFQSSDRTGIAIQPQGSAGSYGAMVTLVTNNSFNYLNAVAPQLNSGNNAWEGWTFTQNKFSQSSVTVKWANEVNFIGDDFSGANFTIGGAVFDSSVSNNYFDSGGINTILLTVQNLVGGNAALHIVNNHFELGGQPNQTGVYFQGGGGTTGVVMMGNTYSGISPSTGTSFSITSNVLTVVVANTFTVGEVIGLDLFTTGTYLNGQTVTVVSSSTSQFTAAFTHANVGSTTDAGRSFPVSYGIWFNDVSLRNVYVGGENFRLNWAALHFTGTLDRSTIESFEARDVHFYADNLAANAGTYLRAPYLYTKIPVQISATLLSAVAGTFGLSLVPTPLYLFPGFTFSVSTTSCSANTSLSLSQTSDGAISTAITATSSATPGFNHCEGVVTFDGTLYVPPR